MTDLHIAFTGTQRGTTEAQRNEVYRLLECSDASHFHHGDCVGADTEIDEIARAAGYRIHIHPPENKAKRAFCEVRPRLDTVYPLKPYLARNRDIVDSGDTLIATPGEMVEQLRSGTWSTIRYARRQGKLVLVVLPDGSTVNAPQIPR